MHTSLDEAPRSGNQRRGNAEKRYAIANLPVDFESRLFIAFRSRCFSQYLWYAGKNCGGPGSWAEGLLPRWSGNLLSDIPPHGRVASDPLSRGTVDGSIIINELKRHA